MQGSYSHDAEVVVFNYKTRATETGALAGFSIGGSAADPMDTERVSLREAITNITVQKTKTQPQGTFMITLKPTKEWTKIIVPGSWCAIYMSDQKLVESDISAAAIQDDVGNVLSPLKMVGIVMAVRVQKQRDANGAFSLVYTISGYDFGYVFTSSIYINHVFQADVIGGVIKGPLSDLSYNKDGSVYGDPATNVSLILKSWSTMSSSPSLSFVSGDSSSTSPPSIRMEIPKDMIDMFGTGKDVLQFVNSVVGVDQRESKIVALGDDGESDDFDFKLIGLKEFQIWQLITNNTLWGMINQYLNPVLNEAYCDLHAVDNGMGGVSLRPMLVVRQIPFNTPDFDKFWAAQTADGAIAPEKYKVTNFATLPKTVIPQEKVLGYDVGYSDYDRVNFVEINAFDKDLSKNSPGAFNNVNKPRFEEGSIRRFGLRPRVHFGADYGVVRGNVEETGYWSPVIMDWWFNGNRYANGTIECIGLLHHLAIGENLVLEQEKILGHVEGYTHTFSVDENGNKLFRTNIDFTRGISSDSTATQFKYVYGDSNFGGNALISAGIAGVAPQPQEASLFEKDVNDRSSYTETNPQGKGKANVVGDINVLKGIGNLV